MEALANKSITPVTVLGDYSISLDDLKIVVNGPESVYDSNESNNSSLIVSITDNNNNFLFMGDAQNARIKDFNSSNSMKYKFLKVPYHGNYLKRLDDLLSNNTIEYAVITSSLEEVEASETLEMLESYNIKYFLTRKGAISVLSDGNNIIIKQ